MANKTIPPDALSLWQRMMRGVTPLADRHTIPERQIKTRKETSPSFENSPSPALEVSLPDSKKMGRQALIEQFEALLNETTAVHKREASKLLPHPVTSHGVRKPTPKPLAPFEKQVLLNLKRGRAQVEAKLDLHGLTQSQAHQAVIHFIVSSRQKEYRLVLIITGKGISQPFHEEQAGYERGILRRVVPQWLKLASLRTHVLSVEHALLRHGGEGAYYVRLRRRDGRNHT